MPITELIPVFRDMQCSDWLRPRLLDSLGIRDKRNRITQRKLGYPELCVASAPPEVLELHWGVGGRNGMGTQVRVWSTLRRREKRNGCWVGN